MPRIGQYQLGELLGEGGIGRVHVAHDILLGREVAIKSLRPEFLNDAGFVERFRTEATNLARLNHPNITTVHSLLEQGGNLYIVMERVRGQTLEEILRQRKGGLGVRQSLGVVAQAADGLAYAHSMGVIHRDIKPANIMIVPSSGLVKIMDFGIARLRGSQRMTRDGRIVGTLAYMAPEQLRGEPTDERCDLYSLAIVFHEILTGSPPFVADTEYDLMQAQIHAKPPRLRSVVPDADPRLEAALSRALAKSPERRFASMLEFKDAIGASAGRLETAPALDRAPSSAESPDVSTSARDRLLALPTTRYFPMIAGATALVASLIVWGVLTLLPDKPRSVALKPPAHHSVSALPSDGADADRGSSAILSAPRLYPGRAHDNE